MGCRRVAPQAQLVRVVQTPEGLVVSRKAPGRGAWLCAGSAPCFDHAARRKAFGRALGAPVDAAHVERLRTDLGW